MAKVSKPAAKPEEKKTWTAEEHNYSVLLDRILTFHALSLNRSIKERDPPGIIDAGDALRAMILNEKVQEVLKSIYAKPAEEEKADDGTDTTKPPE